MAAGGEVAWQYVSSPVRINVDKGPLNDAPDDDLSLWEHSIAWSADDKAASTVVEI